MSSSLLLRVIAAGAAVVAVLLAFAGYATSRSSPSTGSGIEAVENPYLLELVGLDTYSDQATVAAALAPAQSGDFAASLERLYAAASAPQAGDLVNCHAAAHEVGRLAAASDQPIEELMRLVGPECNYGFLHSLVKFRLAEIESDDEAAATGQQWCRDLLPVVPAQLELLGECEHGIGHAAWARFRGNIFQAWTEFCTLLDPVTAFECAAGLAMEWSYAAEARLLPVVPAADSPPLDACMAFPLPQGRECVRSMARNHFYPPGDLEASPDEVRSALEWCASTPLGPDPQGDFSAYCVGSLANALVPRDMPSVWQQVRAQVTDRRARDMFLSFAFTSVGISQGAAALDQYCELLQLTDRECRIGLRSIPAGATPTPV